MNIAIIMGVSNYLYQPCLPGCSGDISIITKIFDAEARFEKITIADDKYDTAEKAFTALAEYVSSKEKETVDEVFFYYTGHGFCDDNDFYYPWKDFQETSRSSSSFKNSDVDELLKRLKSQLVVKFIDACHSGVTYIKDPMLYKSMIEKGKLEFKDCYFFFSSLIDQTSKADSDSSFFTRSFVRSLKSAIDRNSENVRYKFILDYMSDDATLKRYQDPYFVSQAKYTEVFCNITNDLVAVVDAFLEASDPVVLHSEQEKDSLLLKIEEDAKMNVNKEQAEEYFSVVEARINNISAFDTIAPYYEISVYNNQKISSHLLSRAIPKWLESNNTDEYFVEIEYITEKRSEFLNLPFLPQTHEVPFRYNVSWKQLIVESTISFKPRFPNLTQYFLIVWPVISTRYIVYFYDLFKIIVTSWDTTTHSRIWNEPSLKKVEIVVDREREEHTCITDIYTHTASSIMKLIRARFDLEK